MYRCYNWQIANDTYVPLPDSQSEAAWRYLWLEYLEWFKDNDYFPIIMGIGGHC